MTRVQREELNALSKECFGTTSRWQKIVNNGVAEPMERKREVMVPSCGGFAKKTFTDRKSVVRRYSVEEVKALMEDILKDRKIRNDAAAAIKAAASGSPVFASPSTDFPKGSTVTVQGSDGNKKSLTVV